MIAITAVVLWSRRRRDMLIAAAVLAWLLGGLVTSFSQSSIAALLLGLAMLAAYRWEVRAALYASLAVLALAGAVVLLAPASLHFGLKGTGGSTSNATSGRSKLIEGGLEVFAKRPLQGYGAGSFEAEYRRHARTTAQNATSASHTIPVTVAAEQGVIGEVVYVALVIAACLTLVGGARGDPTRAAIGAAFLALVFHTLLYADFLEDPVTWALLAVGCALAARPLPSREPQPSPVGVAPAPVAA